jgi:hypothetical protein
LEINLPLGAWRPDMPDFNNPGVTLAHNVSPNVGAQQGAVVYEPLRKASLYSNTSMTGRPLGTAVGLDKLGNAKVYAGSATRLYKINPATRAWQSIGRASNYSTAEGEVWETTEYGNSIFFTNYTNELQYINKDIDLQFADATTLVKGRHIATVKDFVVVANTYDALDGAVPFRVRWSGLGLPLSWDFSQATGADFQDVYGFGAIQGITGGESGWLLMQKGVVKMQFQGYPLWFAFEPVPNSTGCSIPQSVIKNVEGSTFFVGEDGFYQMNENTGQTTPIGVGQVDQWFLNSVDTSQYTYMTVAADPRSKLIYWSYVSVDAEDNKPDRLLIYNYATGNWSYGQQTSHYIFGSLSLPWTIDMLDTFGTIDAIPASPDSPIWAGGNAMLWTMNSTGAIYVYGGENLPATIETGEFSLMDRVKQGDPDARGDRATILKARARFDGSGGETVLYVGGRDISNGDVAWGNAMEPHPQTQFAYPRNTKRYHRLRVRLNGDWTRVMELQLDAKPAGSR